MPKEKLLDRNLCRQIKKKNQAEMEAFLTDIYNMGLKDAGVKSIDLDKLKEDISKVKGIGTARLDEIMKIIQAHLETPGEESEE